MSKISTSPRKVKGNPRQRTKRSSTSSKRSSRYKTRRYRVKNWSEYTASLKRRGSLTFWFSTDAIRRWHYMGPRQRGGQYTYSDMAIETGLTLRAVYHLGFRQTEGLLESLMMLCGLALEIPDYSTLCRRQAGLSIALPHQSSDSALHIVIDSTGLKVYGEGEWKVRQHGFSKRRTWRKLHICVDEASGKILASTLTTNSVTDADEVEPMLEQIEDPIEQASADSAYDRWKVYDCFARPPHQDKPIRPIIPPQKNAKIKQHGNCAQPPLPRDEIIRAIRRTPANGGSRKVAITEEAWQKLHYLATNAPSDPRSKPDPWTTSRWKRISDARSLIE